MKDYALLDPDNRYENCTVAQKERYKRTAIKQRRKLHWLDGAGLPYGYREFVFEFLMRRLRAHLSSAEFCLVLFVFERTVWWNKEWETIRITQFVNGTQINQDTGEQFYCGAGLSRSTVLRTLSRLIEDGVVRVVRTRRRGGGDGPSKYALPLADQFCKLPRFEGADLRYTGRIYHGANIDRRGRKCDPWADVTV